jgi:hypothetical protein
MSDYREGCIHAKKVKAGIVDQRPVPNRSKKAMPIILESRPINENKRFVRLMRGKSDWRKWAAYRNVREAEQARDNLSRKYSTIWEFRVKPSSE